MEKQNKAQEANAKKMQLLAEITTLEAERNDIINAKLFGGGIGLFIFIFISFGLGLLIMLWYATIHKSNLLREIDQKILTKKLQIDEIDKSGVVSPEAKKVMIEG